jgi:phospholipid transport system substrate-binding protein
MTVGRRWGPVALAVACVAAAAATPTVADERPATQTVVRLNATLLDVLQHAEALGYQGRVERLTPVMGETFDLDFMAEKSLGLHWNTLSDTERRTWLELFRDFIIANYAGNFDHWAGQRFDVLGEEPSTNGTVLVRTRVIDPRGEDVDLSYRLHDAGGWKIADVYLKGMVSELAMRRSDYTSVIERSGFPVLVDMMRGKIADLAAGRGKRQM